MRLLKSECPLRALLWPQANKTNQQTYDEKIEVISDSPKKSRPPPPNPFRGGTGSEKNFFHSYWRFLISPSENIWGGGETMDALNSWKVTQKSLICLNPLLQSLFYDTLRSPWTFSTLFWKFVGPKWEKYGVKVAAKNHGHRQGSSKWCKGSKNSFGKTF